MKYSESILIVRNVLDSQQCEDLIYEYKSKTGNVDGKGIDKNFSLESCPHAKTGVVTQSTFKMVELDPGTKHFDLVHKTTYSMIQKWLEHLKQLNAFHVPNLSSTLKYAHKYRLLCYDEGAKIHPHIDWDHCTHASCTINLNDDYTGGEFSFFNGKHTVKLGKGDAMIWPADHFWVHEVKPIESGKRYSTNCFICSLPNELRLAFNSQIQKYSNKDSPFKYPEIGF